MAKLDKDAFLTKYSDKIKDNDDLVIELMEDIEDSFATDTKEVDKLKADLDAKSKEYDSLKERYKERFLSGVVKEEPVSEPVVEKNYYDVKEI